MSKVGKNKRFEGVPRKRHCVHLADAMPSPPTPRWMAGSSVMTCMAKLRWTVLRASLRGAGTTILIIKFSSNLLDR